MRGVALELAVRDGPFLERPERLHAVVRLPEHAQPEHADRDDEQGRADERDEQLGVDLAGRRPTARTSGLSARLSSRVSTTAARLLRAGSDRAQTSAGRPPDHVRDQPLSVDPRDVLIGGRDRRHLVGLDVDVVALEVQRAPVAVDRDLELVGGVVRDPVVRGLEGLRLVSQNSRISLLPGRGLPGPDREASRSAPTGSSSGRCPSSSSPGGSSSRSGRSRSSPPRARPACSALELALEPPQAASTDDEHRHCASDQEPPHRSSSSPFARLGEPHVPMFTCRAGPSTVNAARRRRGRTCQPCAPARGAGTAVLACGQSARAVAAHLRPGTRRR